MGNAVSSQEEILYVRAWKSTSRNPIPSDYPENDLPALKSKPSTAVAFSGGGIRAYAGTIGFLAGLRDAGLLDDIRYIGGVSSSAWAVAAYCYGNVQDDQIFLGPLYPPEAITWNVLNAMNKDCLRRLATPRADSLLLDGIFTAGLDKQNAWNYTVNERYLKPVGINDRKYYTWSKDTLEDIFARNALASTKLNLNKSDFLLPRKQDGPFMVLGWTLVGPDRAVIDNGYFRKINHLRAFEVTPLYVGQFSNEYARFDSDILRIGGVIEPYCFSLQGGAAPTSSLDYDATFGELLLPACRKGLDLSNAVSISSYNPGTIFDAVSVPFNDLYPQFNANYFSPAFEDPRMKPMLFVDGSATQKIPLIGFIQRGVEKIIVVTHSYTPIDYVALHDYTNPNSWVYTKKILSSYIDVSLASYFGITPSDLPATSNISNEFRRNHIFQTEQFSVLIEGLYQAHLSGNGTVFRSKWITIDNPYYGVIGGIEQDITFYYLEAPNNWVNSLPSGIRSDIFRPKGLFDGINPEFQKFPHIPGNNFQMSYRETNLLCNLVGWTVLQNANLFSDVFHDTVFEFDHRMSKSRKYSLVVPSNTAAAAVAAGSMGTDSTKSSQDVKAKAELDIVCHGRNLAYLRMKSKRDIEEDDDEDELRILTDEELAEAEAVLSLDPSASQSVDIPALLLSWVSPTIDIFTPVTTPVIRDVERITPRPAITETADTPNGVNWISGLFAPLIQVPKPAPVDAKTPSQTPKQSPKGMGSPRMKAVPFLDSSIRANSSQFGLSAPSSLASTKHINDHPIDTIDELDESNSGLGFNDNPDSYSYGEKLQPSESETPTDPQARPMLNKRTSVIVYEDDPFDNISDIAPKFESLVDCKDISTEALEGMVETMKSMGGNREKLEYLDVEKRPYLFTSAGLIQLLQTTTSLRTRVEIATQIGPRVTDPTEKVPAILKLFRFAEEKEKVREILRARSHALTAHIFVKENSLATRRSDIKSMRQMHVEKPFIGSIRNVSGLEDD